MEHLYINTAKIYILPIVHALAGEEKKIYRSFDSVKPSCVAIGVSPEDIEIIKSETHENKDDVELGIQHQTFLLHLSSYGKITIPPRDIIVVHELAEDNNIPIVAIDIDDEMYANLLTENVSIVSLMRHSRKIKKLSKKKFKAQTPQDFVIEWNKEVNKIKAFNKIEELREEHMVKKIVDLCSKYKTILMILPYEKKENVIHLLERYKK